MNDPGEQHHWFLGEGMVHGVRLRDGQAQWYRNRWVRSAERRRRRSASRCAARPAGLDFAANTNVLEHAGTHAWRSSRPALRRTS